MLEISRYDLRAAKSLSNDPDDGMLQISAYHIQQAVEKALKYCFSALGVKTPKTHDIRALLNELMQYPEFVAAMTEELFGVLELRADTLTLCEEKTRYPSNYMVTRRTVLDLVSVAEKVIDACSTVAPATRSMPGGCGKVRSMNLFDRE